MSGFVYIGNNNNANDFSPNVFMFSFICVVLLASSIVIPFIYGHV